MKSLKNVLLISIMLFASPKIFAQPNYSGCNNSGTWASALGLSTQATNNYCFSSGNLSVASGYASTAIGTSSIASGNYSISLGKSAESYDYSYAFGWNVKANSTESVAIGTFNRTTASGAITIGTSHAEAVLLNSINSSLMIGFNSTSPTLFISDSEPNLYHNGTGKVGIGTIYPYAKLHVNGNSYFNEDMVIGSDFSNADLYVSSLRSKGRQVVVADSQGKLSIIDNLEVPGDNLGNHITTQDIILSKYGLKYSNDNLPAINLNQDNQIFLNNNVFIGSSTNRITTSIYGNVGINTDNPAAELEVQGTVSIGYNSHTIPGLNGLIVNGAVGIGTFSPTEALEIVGKVKTNQLQISEGYMNGYILTSDPVGNATWVDPNTLNIGPWLKNGNLVYVDEYKKVGIGTATPLESLEVAGNILVTDNIKGGRKSYLPLKIYSGTNEIDGSYISLGNTTGEAGSIKMYSVGPTSRVEFWTDNFQIMSCRSNKTIVCGNPNTEGQVKFSVNGELNANLIKVQATEWYDKVFTPEYKLRSIAELEEYIDKNGHLPDMPTDNEVLSEGVDVAQMNALLLKKVEELTLYIIALEKRINEKY